MAERSKTRADIELALDGLDAGDPEAGGFVVLLGFFLLFAFEVFVLFEPAGDFVAVAVVGLVVDDQDVLEAHEVGHDALEHLAFGLGRLKVGAPAFEEGAAALGNLEALAQLEGVVVGDDDLGAGDFGQQIGRDQFAVLVVVVRVAGQDDPEPVADGDAGGDR